MIKPGTPQINPQNINITNTAIMFIEKDFPIKIGSKIAPKRTWTEVIEITKKSKILDISNSTNAKIDNKITVINDPTICTKLMIKANKPQNIGKLTSKK